MYITYYVGPKFWNGAILTIPAPHFNSTVIYQYHGYKSIPCYHRWVCLL